MSLKIGNVLPTIYGTCGAIPSKSTVLKTKKHNTIANNKQTSPIRFTTNAFIADFVASTLVFQKLINK